MAQTSRKKPGPQEERHSLAPLTFGQALDRLLAAPPGKPKKKSISVGKRRAKKKAT